MTSADYAKAATITFDAWCEKVRTQPGYNYRNTNWYRAGRELERETHPPKPPPPPPPASSVRAQNLILMSGTNMESSNWLLEYLNTPRATIMFSADLNESKPNGAYHVTDLELLAIGKAGRQYGWWCDGTATPISEAKKLQAARGGVAVMGQFENDAQYDALVNSGAGLGVGDASNLDAFNRASATALATAGHLHLTGEMMWPNPAYSAHGIPIESVTLYVDRDANMGGYQPLSVYAGLSASVRYLCCVYTGGAMRPSDWQLYRGWTA